jgi:hypothetical protein
MVQNNKTFRCKRSTVQSTMANNKSKKAAKRGNMYETVSNNIQKITRPSGTVSYRVRVTEDGVMYSQYETSLKKAKSLRNEWVG